jgi:hypothetical protein
MFQACTLLSNGQVPQGYDLSYIPLNILDNEETELKHPVFVLQHLKNCKLHLYKDQRVYRKQQKFTSYNSIRVNLGHKKLSVKSAKDFRILVF